MNYNDLNSDAEDARWEGLDGNNVFLITHTNETHQAVLDGRINNKGIAVDKATPFIKNGLTAVIIGVPRYSDRDAVMGYDYSLNFVGPHSQALKFSSRGEDSEDLDIVVLTSRDIDGNGLKQSNRPTNWSV
jgi:hypothetical protein